MIRRRIIWRDSNGWTRETLGLDQELESPVDGVELGGGAPVSRLFQDIMMEDSGVPG